MESILRGIVSSEHSPTLKKQLLQKLFTGWNRSETNHNDCIENKFEVDNRHEETVQQQCGLDHPKENVISKGKLAGLSFKHLVYVKNKCTFFQKLMPQKMQFQIVMTFQKIDSKCMLSIAG